MAKTKRSSNELDAEIKKSNALLKRLGFDVRVLDLRLGSKIRKALEEGRMTVEHRGHYGNGRYDIASRMKDHMGMPKCRLPDARKIVAAIDRKGKARGFVSIGGPSCLNSCPVCDEHLAMETNGQVMRPTTDCKYPDGMITETELNVPSGKIVVKDDLRQWFDYVGDFNINSTKGTTLATIEMAKIGCAHGFVGNSCPGIYRQADDVYIIANPGYKNGSYEDEDKIDPEGEYVAGICTDLWWYSLVDYDEFKRRAGDITPEEAGAEVFEVRLGVYHFRQMREDLNNEEKDGVPYIYADFKWVREPDPVRDFIGEMKSKNFTLGQIIHHWNTDRNDQYPVQSVIDHIFCVIGGGGDWHENGFIQFDPNMPVDSPEAAIPKFDKPTNWYGLHPGYSAVCVAAGVQSEHGGGSKYIPHLNSSFLKVAFDLARNIYLFGSNNEHCNDDEQKEIALQCLQGLAKKYPKDIPKDCKVLLMPVIDQANWVLELLQVPVTFYWKPIGKRKNLYIKNEYHDGPAILTPPSEVIDNQGRRDIRSPGKYMKYGHAQTREAMYWASLIGQFALWIKGQPRTATDDPTIPYRLRGQTFLDHRCSYLKPKSGFKERLAQTSYNSNTIVLEGKKEAVEKDVAAR